MTKRMGMVNVAALAANTAGGPLAAIIAILRLTNSVAIPDRLS